MTSFEEVIQPFYMDSDTFYAKKVCQTPIPLDIVNYNYYIKLLQVQFSNVVPNITNDLYVKDGANTAQLVVGPGIYEITNLCDAYNALGLGKLEFISNTGKCKLTNDTLATLSLVSDFLTSDRIGFDAAQIASLAPGDSVVANHVVSIQDYNYFVLTSDNIIGHSMTGKATQDIFEITNTLWTFSSAMAPMKFKTWTAIMPILFRVDAPALQYISFEIRDGNGNKITQQVAKSDFHIDCQLVRQRKL
jgi:hypothetical protein